MAEPSTLSTSPSFATGQECFGCKRTIDAEQHGLVIALRDSFWHRECFVCSSCKTRVDPDMTLLILGDGSPVCMNCTYQCAQCKEPIQDEAVMTGDLTYHSACFKCQSCHKKIEDLVFAKTSSGIYCMPCHNEKAAKSRRRTKRRKEKSEANGGDHPLPPLPTSRSPSNMTNMSDMSASSPTPSMAPISGFSNGGVVPPSPHMPSPTSSHFYTPSSTPLMSGNTEFPSAKRTSILYDSAAAASSSEPDWLSPEPSNYSNHSSYLASSSSSIPNGAQHFDAPNRTSSYEDGASPSGSYSRTPTKVNGLGVGVSSLGVPFARGRDSSGSLETPVGRDPRRRSMQPGMLLSTDALSNLRQGSGSGPSSPRSLSPVPPSTTSLPSHPGANRSPNNSPSPSPSDNSFHSYPSPHLTSAAGPPGYQRAVSPSLMPPSAHSFPPSRRRASRSPNRSASRSREPSPDPCSASVPHVRRAGSVRSGAGVSIMHDEMGRTRLPNLGEIRSPSPATFPEDVRPSFESRYDSLPPTPPPKERRMELSLPQARQRLPSEPQYAQGRPSFASATGRKLIDGMMEGAIVVDGTGQPPEGDFPEDGYGMELDGEEPEPEAEDVAAQQEEQAEEGHSPVTDISTANDRLLLPAPALPPMRFSLYGTDFSDLLMTVSAEKSLEEGDQQVISLNGTRDTGLLTSPLPGTSVSSSGGSTTSGITPTGLKHVITDFNSDNAKLRPISASAPAGHMHFSDVSDVSPASASPRPSFSISENGEEDDVLAPLSAMSVLSFVSTTTSESPAEQPSTEAIMLRLKEALSDAETRDTRNVILDTGVVVAVMGALESTKEKFAALKSQYDGIRRKSHNYIKGLNVAGAEYDREVALRREVEAEVMRLRVQISDQAARLTSLNAPEKATEQLEMKSRQLQRDVTTLVQRLSQLKVERDVTIAEVQELTASKSTTSLASLSEDAIGMKASRSLSRRLDEIKSDYLRELEPLQQQRESLAREVQDLRDARSTYLEETASLQARNEELSALNAQITRQVEAQGSFITPAPPGYSSSSLASHTKSAPALPSSNIRRADESLASVTTTYTFPSEDTRDESEKFVKVARPEVEIPSSGPGKKFRWYSKPKEYGNSPAIPKALPTPPALSTDKSQSLDKLSSQHNFQQHSVLRLARCEHCLEKMWGLHLRCQVCGIVSHARCQTLVNTPCHRSSIDKTPTEATVFGRDLIEQVHADAKDDESRLIPIIVQKCIDALESRGMDYEGIYRKTGGSSQCKNITQLFEKGNYDAFDLNDPYTFNDVSSITSVLKTYFRTLPNPLFTHALHDAFVSAGETVDLNARGSALSALIHQLPQEHFETIKYLMLHLHRITNLSEINRMNSQNLGVVFGPTLMRSADRSREFSDMAGETQTVRWLIENAPVAFAVLPVTS